MSEWPEKRVGESEEQSSIWHCTITYTIQHLHYDQPVHENTRGDIYIYIYIYI